MPCRQRRPGVHGYGIIYDYSNHTRPWKVYLQWWDAEYRTIRVYIGRFATRDIAAS
jgi:hypothetical protein